MPAEGSRFPIQAWSPRPSIRRSRRKFRTAALGSFENSGSSKRPVGDGRYVYADASFSVGFKGDPERALGIIREALWWIGAPADTDLDALLRLLLRRAAD